MSKLWNTLKSVVGSAAKQAEAAAVTTPVAATSSSTPPPAPPSSQQQSSGMLQNLVAVKPHIPLIKFRKGLSEPTSVTGGVAGSAPIVVGSVAAPVAGGSLEWWEVPAKFRREAIDDMECEAINSGGREMPWC